MTQDKKEIAKPSSISMYDYQWNIVRLVAENEHRSLSSALRCIVDEYGRNHGLIEAAKEKKQ